MLRKSFHLSHATIGRPRLRWVKSELSAKPTLVLEIPLVVSGVDLSLADDVAYYSVNDLPVEVDITSLQGLLPLASGAVPQVDGTTAAQPAVIIAKILTMAEP